MIACSVLAGIVAVGVIRRGDGGSGDPLEPDAGEGVAEAPAPPEREPVPEPDDELPLPDTTRPSHLPLAADCVLPPLADMVAEHGSARLTAFEDLELLSQAIAFQVRVTGGYPGVEASDLEVAAWLAGVNEPRIAVFSPEHPSIDAEGRLIDRWHTPYRFVVDGGASGDRGPRVLRIESAGPDAEWGGFDDLSLEMQLAAGA